LLCVLKFITQKKRKKKKKLKKKKKEKKKLPPKNKQSRAWRIYLIQALVFRKSACRISHWLRRVFLSYSFKQKESPNEHAGTQRGMKKHNQNQN
jgi:hypothetical protein